MIITKDKKLCIKAKDILKINFSLSKNYWKTSIFFIVVAGMFGFSTALQTVILGHLSNNAIAANSIASTLYQLLKVASVGMARATAIVVGKTIGENRLKDLKEYVKTLQIMFLCVGILTSISLYILRMPILLFYNISEVTIKMAEQFSNGDFHHILLFSV